MRLDDGMRNHSSTISLKVLTTMTCWNKSNLQGSIIDPILKQKKRKEKKKRLPSLLPIQHGQSFKVKLTKTNSHTVDTPAKVQGDSSQFVSPLLKKIC